MRSMLTAEDWRLLQASGVVLAVSLIALRAVVTVGPRRYPKLFTPLLEADR